MNNTEDETKKELLPKQICSHSNRDTCKTISKDDVRVISDQNGTSITYSFDSPGNSIQFKPDHHMSYDRLFPKKDIVRLMRTFSEDPGNIHTNASSESGSKEDLSVGTAVIKALSQSSVAIYGSVGQEYGSVGFIRSEQPTFFEMEIEEKTEEKSCFGNVTLSMLLSRILAFKLLKNKLFMLFVPSSMLSIIGFALIITYIPPHARDVGIDDSQTALLVSIISGCDLAGKFITAFISDSKHVKRHLIFVVPMLIVGTACQFVPFMTNFWSFALFSAIYGFSGGFYFAILAVVVIDFVGVANLSSALGIMVLSHGIAKAATTPILGMYIQTYKFIVF
ncbi:hypothetical protein KUTeg_012673 [Tegillarca granosa]|uniref:Major facilitator superfamily (MFS) profile domain-containing protein n=1 Tax=Tegillarca granosa TaxID=220873 RepID=A0ABQ9F088_TEGGR|nr:hypothetical protein KUTeg_012673 [Tegillarca granosa]